MTLAKGEKAVEKPIKEKMNLLKLEEGKLANGEGTSETSVVVVEEEREQWTRKMDFLLSCIGYCVGLGNVWRFPHLCYSNGGGAFLVPYLMMLILCGMPLFFMELSLGQYFSRGPIGLWGAVCPMFKGVGFAMLMISFLVCIYYNVIIAWTLTFLFESFRSVVPWKYCGNWWNDKETCLDSGKQITTCLNQTLFNGTAYSFINGTMQNCTQVAATSQFTSPSLEYWQNYILELTPDIGEPGTLRWQLVVSLLGAWILVYFCMWKGVKSSGKVVYFTATFPYVVLIILFFRGVTLPGASVGIKYYLKPEWSKLADHKVWVAAATQIFYSLGIGFGSLIAMSSYNKFHNNCFRDALMVSVINCSTSIFAGFAIFSVLGFMSVTLHKDIAEVAQSGPGLAFVVYPEAIAQMPYSPLWAVLFFFMLLTLGLDSQFAMMEAVMTGLTDEYSKLRKNKEIFLAGLSVLMFLIGLSHVTQGGAYVLNLLDYQSGGVSLLFLGFFEALAVSWFYGTDRFLNDIEVMIGKKPSQWWVFCWKYCAPTIILAIFFFSVSNWSGVTYGGYTYPAWAEFLGWCIALSSMLFIPGVAIYKIFTTPGTITERLYFLLHPDDKVLKEIESREGIPHRVPVIKL